MNDASRSLSSGTIAVVSGASSGIGRAIALDLSLRGARVYGVARREDRLASLVAEAGARGGEIIPITADLSDSATRSLAVAAILEATSTVDILVNSAGTLNRSSFTNTTTADIEREISLNVTALMSLSRGLLEALTRGAAASPRGVADIINISSLSGHSTASGPVTYVATKHAVSAFSEMLRKELVAAHVRVCSVEPGAVDTEMMAIGPPAPAVLATEALSPEHVAEIVSFLVALPKAVSVSQIVLRPIGQRT